MTDDARPRSAPPGSGMLPIFAPFAALVALTCAELVVLGVDAGRPARLAALAALLAAKVSVVLAFFMRAREARRASWLALAAIGFGAGAGVVLVLEAAYRAGVR